MLKYACDGTAKSTLFASDQPRTARKNGFSRM